jgi:hypothetical protein
MPASITYDISPVGGGSPSDAAEDLKAIVADFEGDLAAASFVMSPEIAVALSGIERPNVGMRGGELLGAPVITSRNSPAGLIALIDPTGIAVGEGVAEIRVSTDASIELDDQPDSPETDSTVWVSLFQHNLTGILAERVMNWRVARPGSVSIITSAAY